MSCVAFGGIGREQGALGKGLEDVVRRASQWDRCL